MLSWRKARKGLVTSLFSKLRETLERTVINLLMAAQVFCKAFRAQLQAQLKARKMPGGLSN